MNKITEHTLNGERVFMRKRATGYKQVYPFIVDDKLNWRNILIGGTWANIRNIILIIAVVLMLLWAYQQDAAQFDNLRQNPCDYISIAVTNCAAQGGSWFGEIKLEDTGENG